MIVLLIKTISGFKITKFELKTCGEKAPSCDSLTSEMHV